MKKLIAVFLAAAMLASAIPVLAQDLSPADETRRLIELVNDRWIKAHPTHPGYSWDNAAYYVGNNEAYFTTGIEAYRQYSLAWAQRNSWKGSPLAEKAKWSNSNVYHADNQTCFQVYADLYNLDGDYNKVSRAIEVYDAQLSSPNVNYWWWCDALFMAMPAMTKLYRITGDERYGEKLYQYFEWCKNRLYDSEYHLFFRDSGYIDSKINGEKNFWSRGNGWVFAGLAMVLRDMPEDWNHREYFLNTYLEMAQGLTSCMKNDGRGNMYWTQSMLPTYPVSSANPEGYETSGTAFMTYGLLYGINAGLLDSGTYLPYAMGGVNYLKNVAIAQDGFVGYCQEIGAAATKATAKTATQNFGVGATLLALCELYRYQGGLTGDIYPYLQRKMNNTLAMKEGGACLYASNKAQPSPSPLWSDGVLYLPLRSIAEALGYSVKWMDGGYAHSSTSAVAVKVWPQSRILEIDGRLVNMSAPAISTEGVMYVPADGAELIFDRKVSIKDGIIYAGVGSTGFYPCEAAPKAMLEDILASGNVPVRAAQPDRSFSLNLEELESPDRLKIASASAVSIPEPDNPPTNAFDDDIYSRYAATDFDAVFDLGQTVYVDKVALSFWKYDQRTTNYSVSVSADGISYTSVFNGSSEMGKIFNYHDIKSIVRYIRVEGGGNSQSNWTSLLEIIPFK